MVVVQAPAQGVALPPSSLDAEEALLGGLFLAPEMLDEIVQLIAPPDFFRKAHGTLFAAMCELRNHAQPLDLIALTELLKSQGKFDEVGGPRMLAGLMERVPDPNALPHYAEIIKEKALLRELSQLGAWTSQQAVDQTADPDYIFDRVSARLLDVLQRRHTRDYRPMEEVIGEVMEQLLERSRSKSKYTGVRTHFARLDEMTLGLQKSDLVVLAARPSVGKTSFAMNVAVNAASDGLKVALFSLEMSAEQLVMRLLASRGRFDARRVKRGDFEGQTGRLKEVLHQLSSYHIYIDDTPGITPMELRSKCRMLEKRHGLDLIVIDYLQLMSGGSHHRSDNRVQEVSEISRALKGIARELSIPVVALSQLSRGVEARHDKRPQLADLRESGAIEQDADIVMFLWRPETGPAHPGAEPPADLDEFRDTQDVRLIVAKHRNGPTGEIALTFEKKYTTFAETITGKGRGIEFSDEF